MITSTERSRSKADTALEHIHNLYMVQLQILDMLDQKLNTPASRKEARASIKEFQKLLRMADARYMGGEDVWEALKSLPKELEQKLGAR